MNPGIPPSTFGLDLEDAILGALLSEGRFPSEGGPLAPSLFSPRNRPLAAAIVSVFERTGCCDLAGVKEELARNGGGLEAMERLFQLLEAVPSSAHLSAHITLLRERARDDDGDLLHRPDPLLAASGLTGLGENAPLPAIETALRALAAGLDGADPLRRGMLREAAIQCLEKAGARSPARLVDAALGAGRQDDDVDDVQGKAVILTDPIPWPEPVDGAALLDGLSRTFSRFVALPEGAADALALWILHAYALSAVFVSALLAFLSPVRRCGKTLILEILGALVPRRLFAANVTAAALFRAVEKYLPTLLVDEADTFLPNNDELRGIINSGHTRTTAQVVRTVGDDHEPRIFSTWCAKAIAMIGSLPATLEDRAIVVRMRRRAPGERVERLRRDRLDHEMDHLRRQAARWAADQLGKLREHEPEVPEALHDRARDNWRPLLAIAEVAGGDWPERARRAALVLSGAVEEEHGSPGIQLLADLRDLFHERGADRLPTAEILEALTAMEDRPWPEWRRGKPLTAPQLARLLRKFEIRPKVIRVGDATIRGYLLEDLHDRFARYLPSRVQHPQQVSVSEELPRSRECNMEGDVTPCEQALTPRISSDVAAVTDPNPPPGADAGVLPELKRGQDPWDEEPEQEAPF